MKIAIHHQPGTYSDRWISYCKDKDISYKIVNCYDSDIMNQLNECDGLLWNWNIADYKSVSIAKKIILAIKKQGFNTYPDVNTSWHYDDKVGQKYLLESLQLPLVKSYIFYSKKTAQNWAESATYPKVFKLKGGASSMNVKLIKNRSKAKKLIHRSFSQGFKSVDRWAILRDDIMKFLRTRNSYDFLKVLKTTARFIIPTEEEKMTPKEKGYIYFQDFVPNNHFDIRLVVIGHRCFGSIRYNRKNDFRASGSGLSNYDPKLIDESCIALAFDFYNKLQVQSMAFDFLLDGKEYKIIEMSYCFPSEAASGCHGYWDPDLIWHETEIIPEYFIIEDFISSLQLQT